MTVSKIRELMQERVIPESVLPDSIAGFLSDEEAPPELDAFTFLNRLHSLGIGSADFLYLLQGCGAPEEAVRKIQEHPDMNLQSLIVTLDGSGLTPKDYTRMLYTARQLWERTLTMRIDPEQIRDPDLREYDGVKPIGKAGEKSDTEDISKPETPEAPQPEPAPEPISEPEEAPEKPIRIKTARQKKKSEPEPEFIEYAGVKPIGKAGRQLPAEVSGSTEEPVASSSGELFTAVQVKEKNEEESPEEPSETLAEPPDSSAKNGRKGGIIAAAAGAAVLLALNVGMDLIGFKPHESVSGAHFAADSSEIFSEIYTAYSAGKIGGGNVQPLPAKDQVFGDLLIIGGGQLGSFTDGVTLWAADPDSITGFDILSGAETLEILPPDDAQFLRVFMTDSGIRAVFSGEDSCGIIGSDGEKTWTSMQGGRLTDIFVSGDSVKLGSVYTPAFTESFTTDDVLAYLPWTEFSGKRAALLPEEIIVTGTAQGCSYAVNVEYSADGGVKSRAAALGDPVYSGAEFFSAALRNGGKTLLVTADDSVPVCESAPEVLAAAAGSDILAAAESSESGTTVYLRGRNLETLGAFTTDGAVKYMKLSGSTLLIGDGEKTTLAVDISDPVSPEPLKLTAAEGSVNGDYALCGSRTASGINITLYKLENGKAVQADSFTKTLSSTELETLSFCGANTTVIDGADCCGMAYRWFDGVSVVDEFAELGRSRSLHTMYDDNTGFRAAASTADGLVLVSGSNS